MRSMVPVVAALLLMSAGQARGQYIFCDTNGDGVATASDGLARSGITKVAVWIVTDHRRNGTVVAATDRSKPLSIFSYEFILAADGGRVVWGAYKNEQPSMSYTFGRHESETEFYTGYGGIDRLPPGKYRLGTLEVAVKSGNPVLRFRSRSLVHPSGFTSFGSLQLGKDSDNTIKFAEDPNRVGNNVVEEPGDWGDSDGIGLSPGIAGSSAPAPEAEDGPKFSIAVRGSGAGRAVLRITTTRQGMLKVSLYDVRGRLIQILIAEQTPAGTRELELGVQSSQARRLASGIYLFRVQSVEGTRTGRVALIH